MKKKVSVIAICIVLTILVLGTSRYLMRMYSNAVTPVSVIKPADHIECVKIVTKDGTAVDCNWENSCGNSKR